MRVGYRNYWERGLQLLVGIFGEMLLPLQFFSSIKLKVLGEGVEILLSPPPPPPPKEITINFISGVAVSNSALQDFFFFFFLVP